MQKDCINCKNCKPVPGAYDTGVSRKCTKTEDIRKLPLDEVFRIAYTGYCPFMTSGKSESHSSYVR